MANNLQFNECVGLGESTGSRSIHGAARKSAALGIDV